MILSLEDKGRWESTLEILDTRTGPNSEKQGFALKLRYASIKLIRTVSSRSAESLSLNETKTAKMKLKMEEQQRRVGIFIILKLATNIVVETAIFGDCIDWIGSNTCLITLSIFSPVLTVIETWRIFEMNISVDICVKKNKNPVYESSRAVTWEATFPSRRQLWNSELPVDASNSSRHLKTRLWSRSP